MEEKLLEQAATTRAQGLIARLKSDADVAYYRSTAAPAPAEKVK